VKESVAGVKRTGRRTGLYAECLRKMTDKIQNISLNKIKPNPYQPRKTFDGDENKIEELAQSLKSTGLLQPIMVRPHNNEYQIAMGERRFRAAKKAGMKEIPAIVRKMDDKQLRMYSIIENVHRLGLKSTEREEAFYLIWKKDYEKTSSMAQMSKELGKDDSYVEYHVSSYERSKELNIDRVDDKGKELITTSDVRKVRTLDDNTAKTLLEAKAEGTLGAGDLEELAPILKDIPEEKREYTLEEILDAKEKAEDYVESVKEEAEIRKGDKNAIEIISSDDEKRLKKLTDLQLQFKGYANLAFLSGFESEKLRSRAIHVIRDMNDHLTKTILKIQNKGWS